VSVAFGLTDSILVPTSDSALQEFCTTESVALRLCEICGGDRDLVYHFSWTEAFIYRSPNLTIHHLGDYRPFTSWWK
jgi:hypothetical protein